MNQLIPTTTGGILSSSSRPTRLSLREQLAYGLWLMVLLLSKAPHSFPMWCSPENTLQSALKIYIRTDVCRWKEEDIFSKSWFQCYVRFHWTRKPCPCRMTASIEWVPVDLGIKKEEVSLKQVKERRICSCWLPRLFTSIIHLMAISKELELRPRFAIYRATEIEEAVNRFYWCGDNIGP